MATLKQIEANRSNAQHSTGPRTAEGRSESSRNALKFGIHAASEIIADEDPATLQALSDAYLLRWQPSTPEQLLQVKILVRCDWEDDRIARGEAQLWAHSLHQAGDLDESRALGQAFAAADKTFAALGRRQDANRRAFQKALHTLQDLQKLPPQPIDPEDATAELGSFCQTRSEPPPAPEPAPELPDPAPPEPAQPEPLSAPPLPGPVQHPVLVLLRHHLDDAAQTSGLLPTLTLAELAALRRTPPA